MTKHQRKNCTGEISRSRRRDIYLEKGQKQNTGFSIQRVKASTAYLAAFDSQPLL